MKISQTLDGRYYVEYKDKRPRKKTLEQRYQKVFGDMVKCVSCGKENFIQRVRLNYYKDREYICGECSKLKERSHFWKGGKIKSSAGYILIKLPEHPNSCKKGYVLEHRIIYEQKIGRLLDKKEVVHHIDGVKNNNRIENLMLLSDQGEHSKKHSKHKNEMCSIDGCLNKYYAKSLCSLHYQSNRRKRIKNGKDNAE